LFEKKLQKKMNNTDLYEKLTDLYKNKTKKKHESIYRSPNFENCFHILTKGQIVIFG